ncbi:MAG TPA: DUF4873 domain-containing protein [Pseudonocardiaceae bacterium]|jgi:hypothetical protein|nr:DUF4873 domain-containing protein [Pseudonocardiaceae bacterium]
MNDYQGSAVVEIDGDTPEIPVNIRLSARRSGGRTDWSGTIQARSNDDLARLRNLTQGQIRLPSNQTSNFLVTNTPFSSRSSSERIEIMGNGSPPPF